MYGNAPGSSDVRFGGGDQPRSVQSDLVRTNWRQGLGLEGDLRKPGASRGSAGGGDLPRQFIAGGDPLVTSSSRPATSQPVAPVRVPAQQDSPTRAQARQASGRLAAERRPAPAASYRPRVTEVTPSQRARLIR